MNQIFKGNKLLKTSTNYLKTSCRSVSVAEPSQNNDNNNKWNNSSKKILYGALGVTTFFIFNKYYYDKQKRHVLAAATVAKLSSPVQNNITEDTDETKDFSLLVGKFRPDLPTYTMNEVSNHISKDKRIWVTYKEGVYDVTDFVTAHPGGDNILLAAGSSVEPFWLIYGIHKTDQVYKIMETMRIGNISQNETENVTSNMDDPYANDPKRHSILRPASVKPFNAEPVTSLLVESYITPNDLFYVRNHLPVPAIDPNSYELEIEIEGLNKSVTFTLDQLKKKFKKHTITATVMCAGNRRSEMSKIKEVRGLNWTHAAIGNAVWSGILLRDVLISVGVTDEQDFQHVQFEGVDTDVSNNPYGGSIPFFKAMDKNGDVLLAYEMNGEPIPRDHGFPIRVIVPGIVGARNVKWLGKIIVSQDESPAFWQQRDYKGFNPSIEAHQADFSKAQAIQQLPVISAICVPDNNATVTLDKDGCVLVKGYAWSGGGQKIYRVDVTADGGKTWHVADIDHQGSEMPPKHWGWTIWSIKIPVAPKTKQMEIWVKAVDSSYNTQPETFNHIWNIRGVLNNAYHRINVNIKRSNAK